MIWYSRSKTVDKQCTFICKLCISLLILLRGIFSINWLTGTDELVWHQTHDEVTDNNISIEVIDTHYYHSPIRLAVILVITSVSTFITDIILHMVQRHSMINHCDKRITLLSDTDISFGLFNLFTYFLVQFG